MNAEDHAGNHRNILLCFRQDLIEKRGNSMIVKIPPQVDSILQILTHSGFDACVVGGCVRDSLIGKTPTDWDIATSALPEESMRVLNRFSIIKTGLKHGTVTVISDGMPVEVTTYRIDGAYSDGRRPDSVSFTRLLQEDLSRRDFTVNAMAYRRTGELVDEFGGQQDLQQKIIRCVGDPDRRFQEDGLRILRALRFASVLNFAIEAKTSDSLIKNRHMLDHVARERISAEFTKLICGPGAEQVLREYREVFAQFIPEIRAAFDFPQNNPHHIYDVWEHTLKSVAAIPPDPALRLTMFFHDLGKPLCYSEDKNGTGHFYGHPETSAELTQSILKRLRYSKKIIRDVTLLVREHDLSLPDNEKILRRRLNRLGEENLRRLIKIRAADTLAKCPEDQQKLSLLNKTQEVLERILKEKQCFSLRDLAVKGDDLIAAGIPQGSEVGLLLSQLLNAVLDGTCPNQRDALLNYAKRKRKELH
jgi:tRNA nucleotidyltransferase (CCA-adding enzyme)